MGVMFLKIPAKHETMMCNFKILCRKMGLGEPKMPEKC
jgi:hypothetical protein